MYLNLSKINKLFFKTYKIILLFSFINWIVYYSFFSIIADSLFYLYFLIKYFISTIFFGSVLYLLTNNRKTGVTFKSIINKGRRNWLKLLICAPIPPLLLLLKYNNLFPLGYLISFPFIFAPYYIISKNYKINKALDNALFIFKKKNLLWKLQTLFYTLVLILINYLIIYILFDIFFVQIYSNVYFIITFFSYLKYYYLITLFISYIYRDRIFLSTS